MPPASAKTKAGTLTSKLRLLAVCVGAGASLVCAFFATQSLVKRSGEANSVASTSGVEIEEPTFPIVHGDLNDFRNWKVSSALPVVDSAPQLEEWGTFRPGYYFGMRTRLKDSPLTTGIMWSDSERQKYRHETEQDELARLEWIRHDGQNFGEQLLQDSKLGIELHTSFVIPRKDDTQATQQQQRPAWMQKISFQGLNTDSSPFPLLFYFGMDCGYGPACLQSNHLTHLSVEIDFFDKHFLAITGHSSTRGWFALHVHLLASPSQPPQSNPTPMSYVGMENMDALELARKIRSSESRDRIGLLNAQGQLSNHLPGQAHSLAVQMHVQPDVEVYVSYFEHLPARSGAELSNLISDWTDGAFVNAAWSRWQQSHSKAFDERFHRQFLAPYAAADALHASPSAFHKDPVLLENAKRCLSSLLGGIGFFQGSPSIGNGVDVSSNATDLSTNRDTSLSHSDLTLLTATPSRTVFPRGFLWDEGFHQMVISRWSPSLSLNILQHWLNALHLFDGRNTATYLSSPPSTFLYGWIPREMILGEDARRRVPAEFIDQRVNIANPPTLLLVVEGLLDQYLSPASASPPNNVCLEGEESSRHLCEDDSPMQGEVARTLQALYPRLLAWYHGLLATQSGGEPGSFRWRGRSLGDRKNIPNTLASGLDDYPRSLFPVPEEQHVDLLCWMHRATSILHRLATVLTEMGHAPAAPLPSVKVWEERLSIMTRQLEDEHWSVKYQGYFDWGFNNESAVFVAEVMFRCGNPETRRAMDGFVPIEWLQSQASFCPKAYPQPVGLVPDGSGGYFRRERLHAENFTLEHIPRMGYVTLFPLLLKLLPATSDRLPALLTKMEDPEVLYTEYGLRSLATTDKFYLRMNSADDAPYWRGPIWINVNYLALGALHHYGKLPGPNQQRCQDLYTKLRTGVLSNVFGQYQSTGQFWEQYDDRTGNGIRGHPFTGWTSTVFNILFELY